MDHLIYIIDRNRGNDLFGSEEPQKEGDGQLSLWDMESVEEGYKLMFELHFDQALKKFRSSHHQGMIHEQEYKKVKEACEFWRDELHALTSDSIIDSSIIIPVWESFKNYHFFRTQKKFRQNILEYITAHVIKWTDKNVDVIIQMVDFLLRERLFETAHGIVETTLREHQDDIPLKMTLARINWQMGYHDRANEIYLTLMTRYPDRLEIRAIENPKILELVQQYGPYLTPVYGRISGVFKIDQTPTIDHYVHEDHRIGMDSLSEVIASEQAMKVGDFKKSLEHRKKLHKLSPEVMQAYKALLQKNNS